MPELTSGGGDVEGDGGNGEAVVESDGGGDVGGGDVGGGDVGGVGGGAGIRNQAFGGPSIEFEPSIRAYVSSHRVELLNILPKLVTELVSHAVMSALNDVAEPNISFIAVTELTSHAEMSALKETAP